jgi:CelD/BcsL family acetyltransferase involved in cellulose biosynthesis
MHGSLRRRLTVEWRPLAGLADIAEPWRALAARAIEPNVFYEPAFALAAAAVFGPDAHAALVWMPAPDRRLAGFFPIRVARRLGVGPRLLAGWIHPFAMLGTPLVERDHADAVIAAWLDRAGGEPALPDVALLPTCSAQGPFAEALERVLASRGLRHADFDLQRRALLSPGSERAHYLARSVGVRHRKELPRKRRRLAELGDVVHEVATAEADVGQALECFFDLEARGWKGRRGTAAMQCDKRLAFFRKAVADLARDGKARIDLLRVDGRAIATTIVLRSADALFGWKMAYDESFAKYSPGAQLILDLTRDVLADGAVARVDSCAAANHPLIDHLWCDRFTVSDRLMALRNDRQAAFDAARMIETVHRGARRGAKVVRDSLRG